MGGQRKKNKYKNITVINIEKNINEYKHYKTYEPFVQYELEQQQSWPLGFDMESKKDNQFLHVVKTELNQDLHHALHRDQSIMLIHPFMNEYNNHSRK